MDKQVFNELIAYEYLWSQQGSSLKKLAETLSKKNIKPTQLVQSNDLFGENEELKEIEIFLKNIKDDYSVLFKENEQFPKTLLETESPIDMFYFKGNLELLKTPMVSIVGTRSMTEDGAARAAKLSKLMTDNGYTIVSGLAKGIDTIALETAVKNGKPVIAVIGTPINEYYPKENKQLQDFIANNCLLISQVPFYKYSKQPFQTKKYYFPERDITMAALSKATIVVEASDHSGTLIQARECMRLNKPLFILNSCFDNKQITWPSTYEKRGAIRVKEINDILDKLGN